ncbi:hypothetical protein BCR44DRAFT_38441 [Catenaria anguillulae PL171]|uniref:SCP2 domain-containing protein n=1 Tax=Catenaria anguillulae PL171 TaxID=765915 RepID=A0A1Y2HP87_9FUNG|nr:hypothetical protein BCR44DRAFT_38441 [Catenaria anguillulae PL171]
MSASTPAKLSPPHPDLALSHTLFSGLAAELARDPKLAGPLFALYNIRVLRRGIRKGEYYLLFLGDGSSPVVSTTMPATSATSVRRARNNNASAGGAGANFTGAVAAAASAELSSDGEGGNKSKAGDRLPVVMIEIEQRDLFNFFSGGLNTYRAITSGKIRVAGDLTVAMALEEVFRKAGGVEKTIQYLKKHQEGNGGKAKL